VAVAVILLLRNRFHDVLDAGRIGELGMGLDQCKLTGHVQRAREGDVDHPGHQQADDERDVDFTHGFGGRADEERQVHERDLGQYTRGECGEATP